MNVLQQESVAKAMGMTADTMGGMLMDQEAMSKLSGIEGDNAKEKFDNLVKQVGMEEAKKRLGDETLANQMESASTQDKFNASIEKLKELFVTLIDPLMPILALFGDIATLVGYIITPFTTLTSILNGVADGLGTVIGFLVAAGAAALVLNSSLTFGIGTAIALDAAGAAIVYLKNQSKPQSVQDGIASADKGPFTITDSYGATAITSVGDGLAVSPNINTVNPTLRSAGAVQQAPPQSITSPNINAVNSTLRPAGAVQQAPPQPNAIIDYEKLAQVMSKVTVQSNLDGVAVSSRLQTPMGIATRRI